MPHSKVDDITLIDFQIAASIVMMTGIWIRRSQKCVCFEQFISHPI